MERLSPPSPEPLPSREGNDKGEEKGGGETQSYSILTVTDSLVVAEELMALRV